MALPQSNQKMKKNERAVPEKMLFVWQRYTARVELLPFLLVLYNPSV
jgi:hypothetical protein